MHVTINDQYWCVEGKITLPLSGAWSAMLVADTGEEISGAVTIKISGGMEFSGTVVRTGVQHDRSEVRVVAGAAGMGTSVAGKHYHNVIAKLPISEVLSAAGETLSSTSTDVALNTLLQHWCRAQGRAKRELQVLLDRIGLTWRSLPNGEVWVGTESWAESDLEEGYVFMEEAPGDGRMEIASDLPEVYPGETFEGHRIATVEHRLSGDRLRTVLNFYD